MCALEMLLIKTTYLLTDTFSSATLLYRECVMQHGPTTSSISFVT